MYNIIMMLDCISNLFVSDQKLVSPQKTPTSVSAKISLDKISEGSESQTSRSEKSDITLKEKFLSLKGKDFCGSNVFKALSA